MHNLNKLLEDVINCGFMEFLDHKIITGYKKFRGTTLFERGTIESSLYIDVNILLKNAPASAIKGGFAHELSHEIIDAYYAKKDEKIYCQNKNYRMLDERNADLFAIIRGYGKHLFALRRYADNLPGKKYSEIDGGLSTSELNAILKK